MDSKGIIYYIAPPGVDLDPKLIELFRNSVQYKNIDLPEIEGEMENATLEGKYLITRAGKMTWVTLIINQKPTLFMREGLNWFSIIFEKQYEGEIKDLYTKFQGDISIFRPNSTQKKSIYDIIDEVFHLSLTFPHKLGSSKKKKMTRQTKKIWHIAKQISHKNKGQILLEKLLKEAKNTLDYDEKEISNIIFHLVMGNYLIPIPLLKAKVQYA